MRKLSPSITRASATRLAIIAVDLLPHLEAEAKFGELLAYDTLTMVIASAGASRGDVIFLLLAHLPYNQMSLQTFKGGSRCMKL